MSRIDDWSIKLLEKHDVHLRASVKILMAILAICLIGFFIKFGFEFSATNDYPVPKTIFYGLFLAVLSIILFFVAHFSGGFDFDIKWLGFPIGLAIGGTTIGLFCGALKSLIGLLLACLVGGTIIFATSRYYLTKLKNT